MAKFRVGERVRYVGDRRKADWINQTGVVAKVSMFGEYRVQWDEGHHCSTNYGSGIREASLEPVIDWSLPVELNDGTPLTLVNQLHYTATLRTRDGRDHPAQPNSPRWRLEARLNNGLVISNHKFHVRNILMSPIDPKKPLLFRDSKGNLTPATFITETSEGHILVGQGHHWLIFDKTGNWVRSSAGQGRAITLVNPPSVVERYLTIAKDGSYGNLRHLPGHAHPTSAHLCLTFTDGILTGVDICAANGEPINVD